MAQYLPEMTMGRAFTSQGMTRLALRSYRLYQMSKEAESRGAVRRAVVLRLMSDAYACSGIAWNHRLMSSSRTSWDKAVELYQAADAYLDKARYLSETHEAPTMRAGAA